MNAHLPRRPLVFVTTAYVLGIAFCYMFAPSPRLLAFGLIGAVVLVFFGFIANKRYFVFLLVLVFFGASLYAHGMFEKADPLEAYMADGAGFSPEIAGIVLTAKQSDETSSTLTLLSGGRLLLVRVKGADARLAPEAILGRTILIRGALSFPDTARNPGGFDYRLHLLSKGIRVIVSADAPAIRLVDADAEGGRTRNPLAAAYSLVCRAKLGFLERVAQVLPEEDAALFAGMMFGDKDSIDGETYETFQRGGVAHILSVSGLHVGIVYAFVTTALGRRKTARYYAAALVALALYAVLSEFSPSVVRAVVMIAVHIFSKLLHRRYDLLTGVCFAALLMLLLNPLRLFGTGFQLSFLAVVSLAFSLPFAARFTGFRNRLTGRRVSVRDLESVYGVRPAEIRRARVLEYLIPLFAIQAFMIPVTALRFHVVSVSALALNIPIIALASLVVPFGLVLFALSCLVGAAPFLEPLLRLPLGVGAESGGFLIELMLRLVRMADALPGSSLQVASPPAPCVLAFYALGFFLLSETFAQLLARWRDRPSGNVGGLANAGDLEGGRRDGARACAQDNGTVPLPQRMRVDSAHAGKAVLRRVALIVLVCLVAAASPACRRDHSAFVFVDVGQGDCLHVRTPDGRNYLMDGGGQADYDVGKEILLPYLLQNGVTQLDGVFVSHLHTDHFKGLIELSEHMDIGTFYVYEGAEFSEGELWRRLVGDTGSEENAENTGDSNGTNADTSTGGGRNAGANVGSRSNADAAGDSGESTRAAPGETPPIVFMAAGDRALLGGNAAAEVLYPPAHTPAEYRAAAKNEEDENKSSLLVRFENRGVSVLMTGDVGEPGELDAMRFADLSADILKVGHHGSKTSTSDALLAAVDPAIAVIQVGRNNYGHPTPEILAKLGEHDIIVYRNDLDGAVCVNPARDGFSVKTVKRDCVSPMLWKDFERMRFEQF